MTPVPRATSGASVNGRQAQSGLSRVLCWHRTVLTRVVVVPVGFQCVWGVRSGSGFSSLTEPLLSAQVCSWLRWQPESGPTLHR